MWAHEERTEKKVSHHVPCSLFVCPRGSECRRRHRDSRLTTYNSYGNRMAIRHHPNPTNMYPHSSAIELCNSSKNIATSSAKTSPAHGDCTRSAAQQSLRPRPLYPTNDPFSRAPEAGSDRLRTLSSPRRLQSGGKARPRFASNCQPRLTPHHADPNYSPHARRRQTPIRRRWRPRPENGHTPGACSVRCLPSAPAHTFAASLCRLFRPVPRHLRFGDRAPSARG